MPQHPIVTLIIERRDYLQKRAVQTGEIGLRQRADGLTEALAIITKHSDSLIQPSPASKVRPLPNFMRTSEVAEAFGVTNATIRFWASNGRLPWIKTGGSEGHLRFPREQILAMALANQKPDKEQFPRAQSEGIRT